MRGWLTERGIFIIIISAFLLDEKATFFAWLAYRTRDVTKNCSALLLGVKGNYFCVVGL